MKQQFIIEFKVARFIEHALGTNVGKDWVSRDC